MMDPYPVVASDDFHGKKATDKFLLCLRSARKINSKKMKHLNANLYNFAIINPMTSLFEPGPSVLAKMNIPVLELQQSDAFREWRYLKQKNKYERNSFGSENAS